jgi:hypothetical protein
LTLCPTSLYHLGWNAGGDERTAMEWLSAIGDWYLNRPLVTRALLGFATTVFLIELALRATAPKSRLYARWKQAFEAIGHVWAVVMLSVVYLIAVGPVSAVMRLRGKDLLDRVLGAGSTAWRAHEPNPLGPQAAARHQF